MKLKKLPIGESSFENLINENCIYVDKTESIYRLITEGKFYFLSRPRRFGKSLLVSTLKNIFLGNKELFKGFSIYNFDYKWEKHPVIVIDFNGISSETPEILQSSLDRYLDNKAECFGIELKGITLKEKFKELVVKLHEISAKNVVILIDEYDKPIITHLGLGDDRLEIAKKNREILKSLYGTIKDHEVISRLRFVLLTGVSKFSKAGVFSELNNLDDITMDPRYCDLLGITDDELDIYFKDYIENLSEKWKCNYEETKFRLKNEYNGYRFSEEEVYVYNPYSLLNCFAKSRIKNYWFESGTPTFLVNLIKENNFYLPKAEKLAVEESIFSSYELDRLNPESLLFQTGYLTIKNYDFETGIYILSYPNKEVKYSFLKILYKEYIREDRDNLYLEIGEKFRAGEIEEGIELIKRIYSGIKYPVGANLNEANFHTIFYLIMNASGLPAEMELLTSRGRIDLLAVYRDKIYLFEFKCNQSSEKAIEQIKQKGYIDYVLNKYGLNLKTKSQILYPKSKTESQSPNPNPQLYLIGINFDTETRNIKDWKWETVRV